jgi:SAM-dependent methyltransferase
VSVIRADLARPEDFAPLRSSVDTVICLNVVEHVEDDLLALRNIHSTLQPAGRAVILVPHDQRIFGSMDQALGHYRRYSREQLRARMEEAGFELSRILEFNRVSYVPWFLSGRLLRSRTLNPWAMRIFNRLVPLWRKIDRFVPCPPTSIIAIGVKR